MIENATNILVGLFLTCYIGVSMLIGAAYFVAVTLISVIRQKPIDA